MAKAPIEKKGVMEAGRERRNAALCGKRCGPGCQVPGANSCARSLDGKTARLFPLGTELARTLSEDEKEALDAFVLRFIQCAAMAEGIIHGVILRPIKETREALEATTEDGGAYLAAVNRMPGAAAFLVSLVEWAPQEGWLDPSALPDEVDLGGGAS